MSLIAIDVNETIEYVSTLDKDKSNPTTFHLGVLTNQDKLVLLPALQNGATDPSSVMKLFVKGVKKVTGVTMKNGNKVNMTAEEAANALPFDAIVEVAVKIMNVNFMSEQETKN